jgi:hypothetical protein
MRKQEVQRTEGKCVAPELRGLKQRCIAPTAGATHLGGFSRLRAELRIREVQEGAGLWSRASGWAGILAKVRKPSVCVNLRKDARSVYL